MVAGEGAASLVVPVGLWRALARVGSPARHSPRSNRNYSYKPQFRSGSLRRLSASGGIVSECRFWPSEPAQSNLTPLAVEARTLAARAAAALDYAPPMLRCQRRLIFLLNSESLDSSGRCRCAVQTLRLRSSRDTSMPRFFGDQPRLCVGGPVIW
jgi:hypothetical protein